MNVEAITVGPLQVNCYVAWGKVPDALVVDPGEDADRILDTLRTRRLKVAAYLLTHGHADHVSALAALCREQPAPVVLGPVDAAWAFTDLNQLPPVYPTPEKPSSPLVEAADGLEREDAGLLYRVIATPGHTPGGVCFYFPAERALFSGDTLFEGSVGRTDIPGGSARDLTRSLAHLVCLPDDTAVYPGHGPITTIGREKRTNFFLRQA